MKPRNNTERRVVEISATLPVLRPIDAERIDTDYKRVYKKGLAYYLILERCREFQVIRYYYKNRKRLFEFMQVWFNSDHKVVLAKDRYPIGVDKWKEQSEMTIKPWLKPQYYYSYLGGVDRIGWSGVIVRSVLPELRQRGLKTSCHNLHPLHLCLALLHNNRIETLFKLRQYALVSRFLQRCYHLDDVMWQTIRVALRHGYHWDSAQEVRDWCDMVEDLSYMGIDTNNPHYICPAHLHEAHQHWIEVRRRFEEREQSRQERENALAYEDTFRQNRQQFFGMCFTDNEIEVQIIPTAIGIVDEGEAMHHCVGGYYNNIDSLILSAKVDGKRMETIEVCLDNYKLVQSRGLQNKSTKYHKRIVNLVNANMNEIRERNQTRTAV